MINSNISTLIKSLNAVSHDYISLGASVCEADMLRFLTMHQLRAKYNINPTRLNSSMSSWAYYHSIYESDQKLSSDVVYDIADMFMHLKFENNLSLTQDEKELSPYHPLLNALSPLIIQNQEIDLKALKFCKMSDAQPFLKLNAYLPPRTIKQQIDVLNQTHNRNDRLNQYVYVKRIINHKNFSNLNGQRGVFAKRDIAAGTVIDYYSGEFRQYPDKMPPMLCTWRVQKSRNWFHYAYRHQKISRFNGWTDAFILGNMMKLVNSCFYKNQIHYALGNIGCYYVHLKSKAHYLSLPVYIAIKDIPADTELLTFYPVSEYRSQRVYGKNDY